MRGNHLHDLGLSPAQERAAQAIARCVDEVRLRRRGRVLFVSGEAGSGISHLLRTMAQRLGGDEDELRVAVGGLAETVEGEEASELAERAEALLAGTASVISTLDPAFSLIGPVASLSTAAAGLLRTTMKGGVAPNDLVTRVLRAAAREAPERPLVCLIDDASWLSGTWWTELQFSFAKEAAEELSLLLVLGIDGEPRLGDIALEAEPPPPRRVAQSLIERGYAEWAALEALSAAELHEWLGPAPREATTAAFDLTRGRSGEVAELWQSWLVQGVLAESEEGLILEDRSALLHDALTDLAARVEAAVAGGDPSWREAIREALAIGALEGRRFTAAAVAEAIGRDKDAVEDLLDDLVGDGPEEGILLPPVPLEVEDLPHSAAWTLWRYEFASSLLWRAAKALSDVPEKDAAGRLLDALKTAYQHEIPSISPVMAKLAELADRPSSASHYRSLVRAPSHAALLAHARYLLIISTDDWSPADHRDASYVLSETAITLCFYRANTSLLSFSRRAIEHAEAAGALGSRALARALMAEGRLMHRLGDVAGAEARLEAARKILAAGDPGLLAQTLVELSEVIATRNADPERARGLIEEALPLFQWVKNPIGEGSCKYLLGSMAINEGELALARQLNEEALAIQRGIGERHQEMSTIYQLADIEHRERNDGVARGLLEEALRYHAAVGKRYSEGACLSLLARVELQSGDPEKANATAEAALKLYDEIEDALGRGSALWTMAIVARDRGEKGRAMELFAEARDGYAQLGNSASATAAEKEIAQLAEREGQ